MSMSKRREAIGALGCVLLLLVPRAAACAEHAPTPAEAAMLAPASADAVIVIDGAAAIAESAEGRAVTRVLAEYQLFTATALAWSELAGALGMAPDEALRAVAGRRIVLVVRGETVGRPAGWALLTRVSPATEGLLRKRLKPVPKRLVEGQPVLALENGRFLLATRRPDRKPARQGDKAETDAVVLIAPADTPDLFDACLPLLADKPAARAIAQDPRAAGLAATPGSDVYALWRPREHDEPGAARHVLSIAASRDGDGGWRLALAMSPALLGEEDGVRTSAIPRPLFERMAEQAVVAIAAPLSDARDRGGLFGRVAFRFFSDIAPQFSGGGVIALRSREPAPDGRPRGELFIAAAVKDDPEQPARIDAGVASMLDRLARSPTPTGDAPDFAGAFPEAVREASLPPRALSLFGPLVGDPPMIRWCYRGFGDAPEDGAGARWWLAHIVAETSTSDGSALRTIASSVVTDPEDPRPPAYATVGTVRPARLFDMLTGPLLAVARPLTPLRWIDEARWWASLSPDGLLRGGATITFVPGAGEREGADKGPGAAASPVGVDSR